MKFNLVSIAILLSFTMLLCSCSKGASRKSGDGKPAVTLKSQRLNDKSTFKLSNGDRCTIVADASIDYPVATSDGVPVDSLQRLFAAYVLESGDSLSLNEAMRQVVVNSMHQYVSAIYNKNGVVTFERVDVVKKNDKVTSVTHRYYSFDVETNSYIDVNRLFRDDALADVCQLLKQQLLKQNNATGNEQLNDLGYFNVENITVSRNFYFDENGVTWSYLPNELAVEAVGEPKITIPYGDLTDYQCDNSILEHLH